MNEFPQVLLKTYERVYASRKTVAALRILDRLAVILSGVIFAISAYFAFCRSTLDTIKLILLAAIPFVLVSALRKILSSKRPYEIIDFSDFSPNPPHYKLGSSFPSRHVFSAFVIAVLAFEYAWYLGALGLALGIILAVCRVVLGIHFSKDVICGGVIGIISGIIGTLIL